MGAKRKNTVMQGDDNIKVLKSEDVQSVADAMTAGDTGLTTEVGQVGEAPAAEGVQEVKKVKKVRTRSTKYQAVRAQIDKTKKYDVFAAVELLKKLSYTSFDGTVTAHLVVKETGVSASVTLPHSTGQSVRVAVASEELLKDIEAGTINFDVLVAAPEYMPKLAKFAPVLGPKGLMPNPKNGTLTKDTAGAKKRLEAGGMTVKTEKKAPLMHVNVGKVSMDTKQLVENLEALTKAVGPKLTAMTIAATMSPGIKVNVVEG